MTLEELLRRPGVTLGQLKSFHEGLGGVEDDVAYQVELNVKYRGYTDRQEEMVARAKRLEETTIPAGLVYGEVPGLSREVVEKLTRVKPFSLGQASRISGVTPASITALLIFFKKRGMF